MRHAKKHTQLPGVSGAKPLLRVLQEKGLDKAAFLRGLAGVSVRVEPGNINSTEIRGGVPNLQLPQQQLRLLQADK